MRTIVILGSTGSIGVQALEIVAANKDKFKVIGLAAGGSHVSQLIEQARIFDVPVVAVNSHGASARNLAPDLEIIDGPQAASTLAAMPVDIVLNAITGSIGLGPTLAALRAGNKVALANKESLVAGGELVRGYGIHNVIPVDSEHSALYQCLLSGKRSEVKKAILTASGGAFRDRTDLTGVTLAEALAHPTWAMGPVVTINSATLVNKGLEIIEAHYLFDIEYSQIEAVIHPQSIIHSMIEYIDGTTIASLSPPNMKGPIAYALGLPDRVPASMPAIDWSIAQSWSFAPIDHSRFPAIDLARHFGTRGGGLPAVFNAANEVAVSGFIQGKLAFTSIIEVVSQTAAKLDDLGDNVMRDLDDVSAVEKDARMIAESIVMGIN